MYDEIVELIDKNIRLNNTKVIVSLIDQNKLHKSTIKNELDKKYPNYVFISSLCLEIHYNCVRISSIKKMENY
jgi:lambda repressor-like predicted transcriptional regulator